MERMRFQVVALTETVPSATLFHSTQPPPLTVPPYSCFV